MVVVCRLTSETKAECALYHFQNVDEMLYGAVAVAIGLRIDNVPGRLCMQHRH